MVIVRHLPLFFLTHDAKPRAEQMVEQGGFTRVLTAKDGDEVVVETGAGDALKLQVGGQGVVDRPSLKGRPLNIVPRQRSRGGNSLDKPGVVQETTVGN